MTARVSSPATSDITAAGRTRKSKSQSKEAAMKTRNASLYLSLFLASASLARAAALDTNVTFSKEVAPILQRSCQSCHHPGTSAPMSLMTYQEARPWARAIKERVVVRDMPPWHLDKTVGIRKYKNDRSLSDDEIATIARWVDAGAPRGNPSDLPPPL